MTTLLELFACAGASAYILSSIYIPNAAQTVKKIEITIGSSAFFNIRNAPSGNGNGDKK
jgi:hypothetical protein